MLIDIILYSLNEELFKVVHIISFLRKKWNLYELKAWLRNGTSFITKMLFLWYKYIIFNEYILMSVFHVMNKWSYIKKLKLEPSYISKKMTHQLLLGKNKLSNDIVFISFRSLDKIVSLDMKEFLQLMIFGPLYNFQEKVFFCGCRMIISFTKLVFIMDFWYFVL